MFKQGDSSSRRKMDGCLFQQILRQNVIWFLSYHWKTLPRRGFTLKSIERLYVSLKNYIFKIALCLRNRHFLVWQSLRFLNVFNTLTLKQIFWKTKIFLKKLENHFFSFEYYEWKRNIPKQNWTALSKAISVKTNWMGSTKWT